MIRILLAGGLLAAGVLLFEWLLPPHWFLRLPVFLIPYLTVGWDVIKKAFVNLSNGQWMDENFLMVIATVGAICISEYPEAVFVMLFYQVGELFQRIAVERSRRSIASLMEIRPDEARVERGGEEVICSPEEVAVNDILVIRPGERIPLDGVILQGRSELNTKSLTGESLPRSVEPGDEVISGTVNISGLLRVRVTKPYGESTVAKILELVEASALVKSKTEKTVTTFAHYYTPAVILSAAAVALLPPLFLGDWSRWIYSALIFLVVSCPCALVISVPLSYFGGLGAASRRGILIKGASYLEALAKVDTVVFDKTGTLTEGSFSVSALHPLGISEEELILLAASAEQSSNHPIAQSLRAAAEDSKLLPLQSVTELTGLGVFATVNGKKLLVGNAKLMEQSSIAYQTPREAGTVVYVAEDGRFRGSVVIADRIKDTAKAAVDALTRRGVTRTVMLTGDRQEIARAASAELGLTEYRAELLPAEKVQEVEALLKAAKGKLAFAGDGVNDAPVLARADVGIAMGAMGSDAAIEAADVVLMDDDPRGIARAIGIARRTKAIVWQNIWFALGIKLLFLLLSVLGMTNLWAATFADVGVAVIAILNAMRAGKVEKDRPSTCGGAIPRCCPLKF